MVFKHYRFDLVFFIYACDRQKYERKNIIKGSVCAQSRD